MAAIQEAREKVHEIMDVAQKRAQEAANEAKAKAQELKETANRKTREAKRDTKSKAQEATAQTKSKAAQWKAATSRVLQAATHPDSPVFAVAVMLTLIASYLLVLAPAPLCRAPTPAKVLYFNVTRIPLTSMSAIVAPNPSSTAPLSVCAEKAGSLQPNVAEGCEVYFNFTAAHRNLTGSLAVDCNASPATRTLELCVSRADPYVYILYPYPQSKAAEVKVIKGTWEDVLSHPVLQGLLPVLVTMQMALPLVASLWFAGLLADAITTSRIPPIPEESEPSDTSTAAERSPERVGPSIQRSGIETAAGGTAQETASTAPEVPVHHVGRSDAPP